MHLRVPFSSGWELRGQYFSGLEGARLWLRKSRMAFVSWGAVFIWLGLGSSKARIFFRFRGRLVVAELKSGTCLLGHHFRVVGSMGVSTTGESGETFPSKKPIQT